MRATPASDPDDDFVQLPLDPDVEVVEAPPGPPVAVHLRPAYLAVVFVGGALGTAGREGLGLVIPSADGVPWAVLTANLVGAFLLGVLLESLVRRGADHGVRRTLRLLLGTGFMGGFTTYSALATDTASLFGAGHGWLATAYGLGTVVVGALATTAGILLAAAAHRARFGATEEAAG
jgi:CrcB protein